VRLNRRWTYIYRAIDQDGQVVDAYFSERRNVRAAHAFFEQAIIETGIRPKRLSAIFDDRRSARGGRRLDGNDCDSRRSVLARYICFTVGRS
jgi:transposase-like protein